MTQIENLNYNGQEITFTAVTGTVMSTKTDHKTHIQSSGGGGAVIQGSGVLYAPKVSSKTTSHMEFWIKKEDGSEVAYKLDNTDIPLRQGQEISMVTACTSKTDKCYYAMLVNHSAKEYWFTGNHNALITDLGMANKAGCLDALFMLMGMASFFMNFFTMFSIGWLVASLPAIIAWFIFRFVVWFKEDKKAQEVLNDNLSKIATLLFNS